MEVAGLRSEAVDIRRVGVFVSGVSAGLVAELVGEDVEQIRPGRRRLGRTRRQ